MSNKLTETNNWGVKFFFPCIFKFTKYPIFIQIFVYLSCATSTSVLRYGGLSAFLETKVLNQSLGIFSNFSAETPPHRKAEKRWLSFYPNSHLKN